MNKLRKRLILSVGLFLGLAAMSTGRAAIIETPAPAVTGPGGTGSATINPNFDRNLIVEKSYTNNGYLDLTFSIDSVHNVSINETIANQTGTLWTGFRY